MIVHGANLGYIDPTGGLPPSMWGMLLASIVAGAAAGLGVLRLWGWRLLAALRGRRAGVLTVALATAGAGILMGVALFRSQSPAAPTPRPAARVLVLGLDGLDPILVDQYMAQGRLPNLARLKREGVYHTLSTTVPPQSPVAWASFITGHEPGGESGHGIADFINRNPKTYLPDLSISDRRKMSLPWRGEPFWSLAPLQEQGLTALRLPLTFPPPKVPGRLLAGMGVWDLRGTEGTYIYYSNEPVKAADRAGMVMELTQDREKPGVWRGDLPGPYRAGGADDVRTGFELEMAKIEEGSAKPAGAQAVLEVQGKKYSLAEGRWSDWVDVEFRWGAMGLQKVRAITRVILHAAGPRVSLYVSPLNFDPAAPLYAISYPRDYSGELSDAVGRYHTRGMPFDTQAVNDGLLSDDEFLDQCRTITDEGERMLARELGRFHSGMLFAYFESPDIIQHMFWRAIDPQSPLYDSPDAASHRDVIPNHYQQLDAMVGRAWATLAAPGGAPGGGGTLVVISDHGFAPFRRAVHLNTVLRGLGYLALKEGQTASPDFYKGVDWSRTQAYAVGFNGVYLNLAGREGQGVVPAGEAAALAQKIAADLERFSVDGERPIKRVYATPGGGGAQMPELIVGYSRGYRASWETALGGVPEKAIVANEKKWSGDHCIDASEVPGVFFSSDRRLDAAALMDVGPAVARHLGRAAEAKP